MGLGLVVSFPQPSARYSVAGEVFGKLECVFGIVRAESGASYLYFLSCFGKAKG